VKGLNVIIGTVVFLKNDISIYNPNVASSIEVRALNTPSSNVIDQIGSTSIEVNVRLL
jgi:hypothetical protein